MNLQINDALRMVETLPEFAASDSEQAAALPSVVREACLTSFLVNARLVAEFLVKPARNKNDFSAWDFDPDWVPGPADAVKRLYDADAIATESNTWLMASRYVVHLSKERISPGLFFPILFDSRLSVLSAIREDVRAVMKEWEPRMLSAILTKIAATPGRNMTEADFFWPQLEPPPDLPPATQPSPGLGSA